MMRFSGETRRDTIFYSGNFNKDMNLDLDGKIALSAAAIKFFKGPVV